MNHGLFLTRSFKSCKRLSSCFSSGATRSLVPQKVRNIQRARIALMIYILLLYPVLWLIREILSFVRSLSPVMVKVYFSPAFISKLFPSVGAAVSPTIWNFATLPKRPCWVLILAFFTSSGDVTVTTYSVSAFCSRSIVGLTLPKYATNARSEPCTSIPPVKAPIIRKDPSDVRSFSLGVITAIKAP